MSAGPQPTRVLVVDDEANIRNALAKILEKKGYAVTCADGGPAALEMLERREFQLLLTDLRLPGPSGLELLRLAKERRPDTEVILMTAYGSVQSAVQAIKEGAYDYIEKPIDQGRLALLLDKAVERQRLLAENQSLRRRLRVRDTYEAIVGQNSAMRQVYALIEHVAPTNATVLIEGESGTGKELVARAIHARSARRDRAFVTLNCGALNESLLESELFGYEKGAFTGAQTTRSGRIEQADGGTLFLDEVGEMSPKTQVDLLRVLQEQEVRRVGAGAVIKVDVRFIAATNRDLERAVRAGTFREDLYYRLNVVPIKVPPLRERADDLPLLAQTFVAQFRDLDGLPEKELSPEVLQYFQQYRWPGNIRELKNMIQRLLVTVKAPVILPEHLPPHLLTTGSPEKFVTIPLGMPLKAVERLLIRKCLAEITSHREKAAQILGLSARALHYKLKRYGLE